MKGGRSKSDTKSAKLSVNKKPTKGGAAAAKKSGKAAKDPNKPKRPASAFFVFMEEFREQYKKEHPKNKSVAAVGKAGGDKWKSLSAAEKAPYVAKADKRKVEYEKKMKAYNKEQAEGPKEEEESEKSVSEVNDEDEDDEEGSAEVRAGASTMNIRVCLVALLVLLLSNLEYILELVQEDDDDE